MDFGDGGDEVEVARVFEGVGAEAEQTTGGWSCRCVPQGRSTWSSASRELNEGTFLAEGTVLCTVTSEQHLAMLRITDVRVPSKAGIPGRMPDYVMTVTLWKTAE
ncbi:hypothetical protein [Streptomyces sp. CB00455]|uniref:hypothetical protein n=1 Tax=Streptomyces sp. CB00455 TaxID=1703927 RepID=UPI000A79FBC1|nr:hypothetical protein [Streptomyces sp. CB00455]